jgi:glycine cleavage system aminomethyltransferase T
VSSERSAAAGLEFLSADTAISDGRFTPIARSPMERAAAAAGARFEERGGWRIATSFGRSAQDERAAAAAAAGWADVSHLGKIEIQATGGGALGIAERAGGGQLELGHATRAGDAWWLPLHAGRALVLCEPTALAGLRERVGEEAASFDGSASVLDVTTAFAAMTLVGPRARDVFARFCALDLRDRITPVHALRPGSIGRQPGILVREGDDRFLFLFGWAVAHYMWTVVADAGQHLGGTPIGVDALEPIAEVSARA